MQKWIVHIILCCLLLASCKEKNGLPALTETYSYKDSKPFGGEIAYRMMRRFYPDRVPDHSTAPFFKTKLNLLRDSGSMYVCISKHFLVEEDDVSSILNYVYDGNTFFLSSSDIDTAFLSQLYCSARQTRAWGEPGPRFYQQTQVKLIEGAYDTNDSFGYYYQPFVNSFDSLNDTYARILGYNAAGEPNCIVFFWGKGKMILHTDPRAFSNYFLLSGTNYRYMLQLFQLLGPEPDQLVWDHYYYKRNRRSNNKDFSTLSEIFKYPPLQYAFWIVLGAGLLYILFGLKRRQRIIEQRKANTNSSVAFTEIVSRLYWQKRDHKNISDKMITYFNDFIRQHYFIPVQTDQAAYIGILSGKSGVPYGQVEILVRTIQAVKQQEQVSDFELLTLHEQIQQFHKIRK